MQGCEMSSCALGRLAKIDIRRILKDEAADGE
jgi:hypothetical protein